MEILLVFVSCAYDATSYGNNGDLMEGDTQVACTPPEGSRTPFKGAGTHLWSHY